MVKSEIVIEKNELVFDNHAVWANVPCTKKENQNGWCYNNKNCYIYL